MIWFCRCCPDGFVGGTEEALAHVQADEPRLVWVVSPSVDGPVLEGLLPVVGEAA